MLLVFPSDAMTEKASVYLSEEGIESQIIPIPDRLNYKTHASLALYVSSNDNMDIPMKLSREKFIVMRVFREFQL